MKLWPLLIIKHLQGINQLIGGEIEGGYDINCLHKLIAFMVEINWWLLRGEIAAPDHYHPPRGKTRGQGQHLINPQKNYLH
jgi:hypothetical protein